MPFTEEAGKIYQLIMKFQAGEQGWSEKVWLGATDRGNAKTVGSGVANYRLACLPAECYLVYATVNAFGGKRDKAKVGPTLPARGLYTGGDTVLGTSSDNRNVNSVNNAVAIVMENDEGAFSTRWLHGVPDAEAKAGELVTSIDDADTVAPLDISSLNADDPWPGLVTNYMRKLKSVAKMVRKTNDLNVPRTFVSNIDAVYSPGLSEHRTGRFFGQKVGRYGPR